MDLNTIMASQLSDLQQTVQMSLMQKSMLVETEAATQLIDQMNQVTVPSLDPNVGQHIDISI